MNSQGSYVRENYHRKNRISKRHACVRERWHRKARIRRHANPHGADSASQATAPETTLSSRTHLPPRSACVTSRSPRPATCLTGPHQSGNLPIMAHNGDVEKDGGCYQKTTSEQGSASAAPKIRGKRLTKERSGPLFLPCGGKHSLRP